MDEHSSTRQSPCAQQGMRSSTTSWHPDHRLFYRGFPVLSNTRIAVRPNLPGLDLSQSAIEYAFSDLLAFKQDQAVAARKSRCQGGLCSW